MDIPFTAELCGRVDFKELAQGNAMLAFGTGQAFEVDEIGLRILRSLPAPTEIAVLVRELASEYGAEESQVRDDVVGFLSECAELGIVRLTNGP